MASSFVSINGRGFWVSDGILELFIGLASLHIGDTVDRNSAENMIRDQWLLASRGYFSGAVAFNLERDISTKQGLDVVVNSIHSFLDALNCSPAELDFNVFNLLGFSSKWVRNVKTEQLIVLGNAILQLIEKNESFQPPKNAVRLC